MLAAFGMRLWTYTMCQGAILIQIGCGLWSTFTLALCLHFVSEFWCKYEHASKSTYFIAAGTFAVEARDLMLAEMVLTSQVEPPFRVRLLNDLHAFV